MERRRLEEENKTPEEKMRDKLRAQKLAEESDLEVAKEMFSEFSFRFLSIIDFLKLGGVVNSDTSNKNDFILKLVHLKTRILFLVELRFFSRHCE